MNDHELGVVTQLIKKIGGTGSGGSTTLPVATSTTLGGVKVGTGISVTADGTISANAGTGSVTSVSSANTDIAVTNGSSTPTLTLNSGTSANQILKVGSDGKLPAIDGSKLTNINASNVNSGTLPSSQVPIATTTTLGGVKVGNGLNVDATGLTTAKLGLGLKLDASNSIVTDNVNIDVMTLKNANTLVLGSFKGTFTATDALSKFSNGSKGDFWIYNGVNGGTLGGLTFKDGDQLWINTSFTTTPANLTTYHSYVPNTIDVATTTTYGTVKYGTGTPLMDSSVATAGLSMGVSREDHVHPSDVNKISKISSSTNGGIVTWSGTTGNVLADSTKALPTGNVVGTSDTQTLTNKTLDDSTTVISNTSDATKKAKFSTSNISTATTRTYTLPDKNGTVQLAPSTVVLSNLSNITLSENTIYEINNVAVANSTLTLPTGTATGNFIQILAVCAGFNDSTTFNVSGNINGSANVVVNNRSFCEYRFVWSQSAMSWVLSIGSSGY